MKLEQFTVTLSLSPEQVNQLSGLTRLYNDHLVSEGRCPGYTECSCLERLLSSQLAGLLSDELDYERGLKDPSTRRKFTIHTQGFAVSLELNDEQREKVTELAALYNEHSSYALGRQVEYSFAGEVLLSQALDYALQNGLTLDERLEHDVQHWRDNVRRDKEKAEVDGEVGDAPARNPSPDEVGPEEPGADGEEEEPETLVMVCDASGVVREVTLDEAEAMREAAQGIYAGEPPEPDFDPYAPEEEPETVSNAEDKRSPLIKDNSDGYFYYLEHGHWPPDDEVLAGADVPCTGDYGLSDCLVVTQSALDFVDAFFVGQEAGT